MTEAPEAGCAPRPEAAAAPPPTGSRWFTDLLDLIVAFADPFIGGAVGGKAWQPFERAWR